MFRPGTLIFSSMRLTFQFVVQSTPLRQFDILESSSLTGLKTRMCKSESFPRKASPCLFVVPRLPLTMTFLPFHPILIPPVDSLNHRPVIDLFAFIV